ncbi:helix-turn-helix domain-containing protein [Enterobacter roggenkampii]|nr:helix-turn-helix domain-containing protein [Enterobacter roggenkampii]
MNAIYSYFDNIDPYAVKELSGCVEFMTGKHLILVDNLSELMSINDSQEVIIFVNKLTHGATCFCQYAHLNMKVIDVVDDRATSCSAVRRIINLQLPVSTIFNTIIKVINSNHHRRACQLCYVLGELTPEEKTLIKIIREGKHTTEQIATEMGISNKIVSKHKRKIMSKINIKNSILFYNWIIKMEPLNAPVIPGGV